MTQIKDDITSDFEAILTEWPNIRNESKAKISALKDYYSHIEGKNKAEVVEKTDNDKDDLKRNLDSHQDIFGRAQEVEKDLNENVKASDRHVQRVKKHGPKAVLAVAVLCAVIGAVIGAKVPGWGQVVAIVVGGVIGFILFGGLALILYLILRWRVMKRRDMWKETQSDNQAGLALAPFIKKKKSELSEIRNLLDGIEEGNMNNEVLALVEKMDEYLQDN